MSRLITIVLLTALLPCMHGCDNQKHEADISPTEKAPLAADIDTMPVGTKIRQLETDVEWALSHPEALAPMEPLKVASLPFYKYLTLVAITGRFYNLNGCLVFLEGAGRGGKQELYLPVFVGPVRVNVQDNPSVSMPSWKVLNGGRVKAARPIKLGEYVTLGGSLSNLDNPSTLPLVSTVSAKCAYPVLFIGGGIIIQNPILTGKTTPPAPPAGGLPKN